MAAPRSVKFNQPHIFRVENEFFKIFVGQFDHILGILALEINNQVGIKNKEKKTTIIIILCNLYLNIHMRNALVSLIIC